MEISKISMQPLLPRSVPLAPSADSFLAFPENRRLGSLLVLEVMHVAKSQPQGAPHAPGSSIAKTPFSGLVLRRLSRSNMRPHQDPRGDARAIRASPSGSGMR